ncbi:hypothetical protein ZWY2020_039137 [Hordeum vulgare]|nr:hypothetical protein ZWY2020_039137 [Hordeum vulgare]
MAARVGDAAALRRTLDEAALVVAAGEGVAAEANEAGRRCPGRRASAAPAAPASARASTLPSRFSSPSSSPPPSGPCTSRSSPGSRRTRSCPRRVGLAGVGNACPRRDLAGFVATVRADNSANGKVGVHHDGAWSRVAVSYEGVSLADGAWPAFYQAPGNMTVFVARAKGAGIRFSERERGQMAAAERLKSVPFDVDITVPVRLQLGGVRTWALPVTVRCAMAVDSLAASAKVVSRSCDVKVPFLFWRN